MAPLMNNEKKAPFLPMILISRFERSWGVPLKEGGKKPIVINDTGLVCP
jgi:hypothetical protein